LIIRFCRRMVDGMFVVDYTLL